MPAHEAQRIARRGFLRAGGAAAATLLLGGAAPRAQPAGPRVVIARDQTGQSIQGFEVNADIVQRLVDTAVTTLTGKDDVAEAWASYVDPKHRVAIKYNGLFARATTHPEVIHAVANGLVKAGVAPANITVYDRKDQDANTTGMAVNRDGTGIRICGTENQYGPPVNAGPVRTSLSALLTEADVLINVPIMKSHVRCGVTGALKNHVGSVPNGGAFHEDYCAAVADLNAVAEIRDKTRVCVCDALYGLYHAGPEFRPDFRWDYQGIVASVDPVGLDATLDGIITAKRLEVGMSPRYNSTDHIQRAAELGLGVADPDSINRVDVEI